MKGIMRKKVSVSDSVASVSCVQWMKISFILYLVLLLFSLACFSVFFYYGKQIRSYCGDGVFKNPKHVTAIVQAVDGNYVSVSFEAADGRRSCRVLSGESLSVGFSLRIVYDYLDPDSVISETVYKLSQWISVLLLVSFFALVSFAVALIINRIKRQKLLQELEELELLRDTSKTHKDRIDEEEWQMQYL